MLSIINFFTELSSTETTTAGQNGTSENTTTTESVTAIESTTAFDFDANAPPGIKKLNMLLDPSKQIDKQSKVEEAKVQFEENFGSLNMSKSLENLVELLWFAQLPCFDLENVTSKNPDEISLLKRCYWKGDPISCSAIFSTRPTDRGMCCSFNIEKAEETYYESRYTKMITEMQELETKHLFEDKESLKERHKKYVTEKEPRTQAGQNKGLRLVLDAHTDRVTAGSVFDNYRGFVTMVDSREKYPLTARQSFLVKPGRENYVAISALRVVAEDGIKPIEPKKRSCKLPDETSLNVHRKYSQSNCLLECSIEYAKNHTKRENSTKGCTPWYYPRADEEFAEVCKPWEAKIFNEYITNVPDDTCSECLPDCTSTIYNSRVSAAPFRPCDHTNLGSSPMCDLENNDMNPAIWRQMVQDEFIASDGRVPAYAQPDPKNLNNQRQYMANPDRIDSLTFKEQILQNPTYDAFQNDIAVVNFYFDKSTVIEFKRAQRMNLGDYISQMGGLIGLGIGFSFVSAVEIIYWFTIRLFGNISLANKKNSKREKKRNRTQSFSSLKNNVAPEETAQA